MPDVEQWLGTYRSDQATTPRQRRLLLSFAVVGVTLVLGNAAFLLISTGGAGLVDLLPALFVWMPLAAVQTVGIRRSPRTQVSADGLWSRTDVFTTREARWDAVRSVELPGRYGLYPRAVLVGGSRLELPGVPVDVAERLRDALAVARNDPPPASSPKPERRRDGDDEGWDGPFHRG